MTYKIIDGVAYKCEEINLNDIKVEVNQAKAVINEQIKKIAEIDTAIDEVVLQTAKQIDHYKAQIVNIENAIANLNSKKASSIAPFEAQKAECNNKIARVKEQLSTQKDVIVALLPDDAQAIGF